MKTWTRSAAVGFLSTATLFAVCCAALLPALRDPTRTFGPDGEPWKVFVQSAVLPPLLVVGMIGAGIAVGIGAIRNRRRRRAGHAVKNTTSL